MPNIMWLFVVPLVASVIPLALRSVSKETSKAVAIILSLFPLVFLLYGTATHGWIGSQVKYAWLPTLSIEFYLRVDSLSLIFLYLTALIVPVSLLSEQSRNLTNSNLFYSLVLLLEALLIGFFTARDLALFVIFWEAMLIPLYFIIALWGGLQRQAAALKFLIYMIAGSALMIAAVLALYFASASTSEGSTFNLDSLAAVSGGAPYAAWLCGIFFLAFAVKTPMFPFHAWLPDAYCQAPTAGTLLLSAILSKAGIYGFLRIGLELFPTFLKEWSPLLLGLAIIGVFYGGLAAWKQHDFKRLIAYSSYSHVNFVLVGIFIWDATAHTGAILQAFNHGITIAALFLVASWLEIRLGTTSMVQASGLTKYFPQLSWLTLFFVVASVALPGTNNFIGELLILFGLFGQNPYLAGILGLTIILSVMYMLRWMQTVYFGEPIPSHTSWSDIKANELIIALPLAAIILWIGIYPKPVITYIEPAAEKTIAIAKLEPSS